MKIVLYPFLFFTFFCLTANAQQIPNRDFEQWGYPWENNNVILDYSPVNPIPPFLIADGVRVLQTTQNHSGLYAIKLRTQPNCLQDRFSLIYHSLAGVVCAGTIQPFNASESYPHVGLQIHDGIPFTQRPQSISLYYQYFPRGNDSCAFIIRLYKWNSTLNTRDTIGTGLFSTKTTVSTYTLLNIPITYQNNSTPDSIGIIIASTYYGGAYSKANPNLNDTSTLLVDDISVNLAQAIDAPSEESLLSRISIFPNPASDNVSIHLNNTEMLTLTIYNAVGSKVQTNTILPNERVSVSNLPNGLYYWSVAYKEAASGMHKLIINR